MCTGELGAEIALPWHLNPELSIACEKTEFMSHLRSDIQICAKIRKQYEVFLSQIFWIQARTVGDTPEFTSESFVSSC